MDTQKDGHRYTLSVAHQDLPAVLIALGQGAQMRADRGDQHVARLMRDVRADLIKQRDAQPWVAMNQPGRDAE